MTSHGKQTSENVLRRHSTVSASRGPLLFINSWSIVCWTTALLSGWGQHFKGSSPQKIIRYTQSFLKRTYIHASPSHRSHRALAYPSHSGNYLSELLPCGKLHKQAKWKTSFPKGAVMTLKLFFCKSKSSLNYLVTIPSQIPSLFEL